MGVQERLKQLLGVIALVAVVGAVVFVTMAVLRLRPGILERPAVADDAAPPAFRGPTETPWTNGPSGPPPEQ